MERLAELAAGLGADVPFFLWGGTCLGEGRGEQVRVLAGLPAWPVVVAHPGVGVSTAAAYAAMDALGRPPQVDVELLLAACAAVPAERRRRVSAAMANAFEAAVLPSRPDIAELRRRFRDAGADAALLCGSGAAVWALAPHAGWADRVATDLRAEGLWAVASRFWPRGAAISSA